MIRLTDTQQRVVPLVAQGLLNKEIAYRLGITEGTVKCHVAAAIDRLVLKNRVQLAVWFTKWEMENELSDLPAVAAAEQFTEGAPRS